MKYPYTKFEQTPLWKTIDAAIAKLEQNGDVELTTTREHVISYLCQQLAVRQLVLKRSLLRD